MPEQMSLFKDKSVIRNPACQLCPLHKTAEHVCALGKGGNKAMIISEAPPTDALSKDNLGIAFTGNSGKLLAKLFDELDLNLNDFYITNVVHCCPPKLKTPTKKEIASCKPWLDREIAHVKPKIVLLFGNTPLLAVLGLKGIRKLHGKPIERDGVLYLPTYHPSFALRDPRQEAVLKADLLTFKALIEHGGVPREKNLNSRVVNDLATLNAMIRDIEGESLLSYDIETTGLSPFAPDAAITLFGVGTRTTQWSVPLQLDKSKWYNKKEEQTKILKRIIDAAKGAKMCAHNGKFDSLYLLILYGLDWRADFDTMLAHYTLDENSLHGLKHLASVYLAAPNYDIDKDEKQGNTTLEKLAIYHAHDLYYTRKLTLIFQRELNRDLSLKLLFKKLVMPTANMFIDIEREGVPVNVNTIYKVETELNAKLKAAKTIMEKYGKDVNWSSPKQVGDLLFNKLKLPVIEKTPTGANSTSESVLKRLADKHEVPREMLKYREANQLLIMFIEGWQPRITKGRLHPSFKLHGTVTGRLSCEDPNLQQVPRDPTIRSIIQAPSDEWELVEADLSQIELRIAAELANEKNMLHAFHTGVDVHWKTVMREIHRGGGYKEEVIATAKSVSGKTLNYNLAIEAMLLAGPDACVKADKRWKELRKKAKAINFGYLYGMWWKKFIDYARDNYGVVVNEHEAEQSREAFFELYPGFNPWHSKQKKFAKANGYVRTLTGRIRRLPAAKERWESPATKEALRQSINSPVQSFASDLNVMAALEMHEEFDYNDFRILGTVHDAILMLIRKKKLRVLVPRIKKIMSHPKLMDVFGIKLSVPIEAEVAIGPWGASKSDVDYFKESS